MTWQTDRGKVLLQYGLPLAFKIMAALLAALCLWPQAHANEVLEDRLKAAFIYNFTQFIEWPDSAASDSLNICVLGNATFARELGTINGKQAHGKPIVVIHLADDASLRQCHVLFVRVTNPVYRDSLLKRLEAQPVLTVSDSRGFAGAGGTVQFFLDNNRVRFAINKEAADRAGLEVSSKLLSLARIVGVDEMAGM